MLDLRIIAGGSPLPIHDLPAALGRAGAAKELGAQIDALIAFLDDLAGDPDLEDDNEDCCCAGDDGLHPLHDAYSGAVLWGVDDSSDAEQGNWAEHEDQSNLRPVSEDRVDQRRVFIEQARRRIMQ